MPDGLGQAIDECLAGRLSVGELRQRLDEELRGAPVLVGELRALLEARGATLPSAVDQMLRELIACHPSVDTRSSLTGDPTRFRAPPRAAATETPSSSPSALTAMRRPVTATETPSSSPQPSRSPSPLTAMGRAAAATGAPSPALATATVAPTLDGEVGAGTVLSGRYRLLREIGRGGMGVVFLAEGVVDPQQFAVKVLNAEFRQHPDAVQALREEARKSLVLRHPNIVGVYPLELDGAHYYLPMEFLYGKTLRELLDQDYVRGMPPLQSLPIIRGIAAALAFAHDRGVIHSDLKPSNIFVTIGGSARVLDFGIARALRGDGKRFDTGTLGALTEAYASCEMLAGEPPDFRDDIYGLACVVYELLTGNHPFGGRSAVQARDGKLAVAPVRGLNESQNAALRRGLAFRKEERSASLEEFLAGVCGEVTTGPAPRRATWPGWLTAAAVLVASAAGGGWWWLHRGATPELSGAALIHNPSARSADSMRAFAVPGSRAVGAVFSDCPDCPSMVVVPAGQFRMSSSREEAGRAANELPQRLVQFARPFAIGRFPVTRAQFRAFLEHTGRTPSGRCLDAGPAHTPGVNFANPGFAQTDDHPAVCVSGGDAMAYADWINRRIARTVYRLPSEAEWEYSARAGSRTPYAWGESEAEACRHGDFGDLTYAHKYRSAAVLPCEDGYVYTAPVGSFPANAWGLLDMPGNVREWTRNCPHEPLPHAADDGAAWAECKVKTDVLRGAGFATLLGAAATRVAARLDASRAVDSTTNETGFRLVRSL